MNTSLRHDNAERELGEVGKPKTLQFELCFATTPLVKSPEYPSPKHLPGRVLAILLIGRHYTHKDSWIELGHARLADSIWKLRRMGWPVQMDEEVAPTSDAGRTATIGIYYLTPETIAEAGQRGREHIEECARFEVERRAA